MDHNHLQSQLNEFLDDHLSLFAGPPPEHDEEYRSRYLYALGLWDNLRKMLDAPFRQKPKTKATFELISMSLDIWRQFVSARSPCYAFFRNPDISKKWEAMQKLAKKISILPR